MPALTFYLTHGISGNVGQQLTETAPGANATISPAFGWQPGTTGAGNFANADAQTKVPAASFGATEPTALVTTQGAGNFARTAVPWDGVIAAGTWAIDLAFIATVLAGQDGKPHLRIFKHSTINGASATEITSDDQVGTEIINLSNLAQQISTFSFSLGEVDLANQYLALMLYWEITGAGSGMFGASADVLFRTGTTATKIVTPNFTQRAGTTRWRESGNVTNIAGFDTDWVVPANAQFSDGNVAQFTNPSGNTDELSDYLNADTFGFVDDDVPAATLLTGIELASEENADTGTGLAYNSVKLVSSGAEVGTDQSDGSVLPNTMAVKSFGGAGQLLGTSGLTGADLHATTTGWRKKLIGDGVVTQVARVDNFRMRAFFTPSGGPPMRTLMGVGT